jgi:hypothetical protein
MRTEMMVTARTVEIKRSGNIRELRLLGRDWSL